MYEYSRRFITSGIEKGKFSNMYYEKTKFETIFFFRRRFFMEQHTKAHSMEFSSYPYGSLESEFRDHSSSWLQTDSLTNLDVFSVGVVYQPSDFPFPSIHYPSQNEDLLDTQFSIGCVHGGGSMLSSMDVSLESCLGMFV